jgi:hypothetical protein
MKIMKKIYNYRVYVRFEGETEWRKTSMFRHLHYMEEEEAIQSSYESIKITSFEDAKEIVESNLIMNAEMGKTFFTKKPVLRFSVLDYFDGVVTFTEKQFKSFEYKIAYEEESNLSIKTVMELLTADEFCEYLKDKGIEKVF